MSRPDSGRQPGGDPTLPNYEYGPGRIRNPYITLNIDAKGPATMLHAERFDLAFLGIAAMRLYAHQLRQNPLVLDMSGSDLYGNALLVEIRARKMQELLALTNHFTRTPLDIEAAYIKVHPGSHPTREQVHVWDRRQKAHLLDYAYGILGGENFRNWDKSLGHFTYTFGEPEQYYGQDGEIARLYRSLSLFTHDIGNVLTPMGLAADFVQRIEQALTLSPNGGNGDNGRRRHGHNPQEVQRIEEARAALALAKARKALDQAIQQGGNVQEAQDAYDELLQEKRSLLDQVQARLGRIQSSARLAERQFDSRIVALHELLGSVPEALGMEFNKTPIALRDVKNLIETLIPSVDLGVMSDNRPVIISGIAQNSRIEWSDDWLKRHVLNILDNVRKAYITRERDERYAARRSANRFIHVEIGPATYRALDGIEVRGVQIWFDDNAIGVSQEFLDDGHTPDLPVGTARFTGRVTGQWAQGVPSHGEGMVGQTNLIRKHGGDLQVRNLVSQGQVAGLRTMLFLPLAA